MNTLNRIKTRAKSLHAHAGKKPLYAKFIESLLKIYYIGRVSLEKFQKDSCSIRSSAIAYAIAISVIPILTILIRFASIDRVALRASIGSFLAANGMADTTELLEMLDEILGRANQIAGLGILFMLYSATNLVRNLEEAFNHIFRVRSERPMIYRFALYIAAFAIVPTLIIFSTGAARLAFSRLQPAQPVSVFEYDKAQWILHEPGFLWKLKKDRVEEIDLYKMVNTGATFRNIFIDEQSTNIGPYWEIVGKDYIPEDLHPSDLYDCFGMLARDDNIYIFTKKGFFLYSTDRGNTWKYNRFLFKLTDIHTPEVQDALITNSGKIILLIGINSRSGILSSAPNGKWKYTKLEGLYSRLAKIDAIPADSNTQFQNGLYLLGKGEYRFSSDEGASFDKPVRELYGNKNTNLRSILYQSSDRIYLSGGSGNLWSGRDSNQIRPDLRLDPKNSNIQSLSNLTDSSMFMYGSNENFRFSQDHGLTWLKSDNKELNNQNFTAHLVMPNGELMLASENQSVYILSNPQIIKKRDSNGHPMVHFQSKMIKGLPFWFKMTGKILVSTFIFASCFLMFMFTYKFVPNTYVSWKAANVGSLFTSITILGFFTGFNMWITGFTTTGYIYGVWAAIPLGMLVILSSTAIILFGLELAYVIQHPILYNQKIKKSSAKRDSLLWSCIILLSLIYHRIYGENTALTDEQATNYFDDHTGRLEYIRETLLEANLISYNEVTGEYYPVKPASEISIAKLQSVLIEHALKIPIRTVHSDPDKIIEIKQKLDGDLESLLGVLGKKKNNLNLAEVLPMLAEKKVTNR